MPLILEEKTMVQRLSNTPKTILITGASSGIGFCCALGLKARGYRVFATVRQDDASKILQEKGIETVLLDLHDSNSIQTCLDKVLEKTGGTLDFLFNNAGFGQPGAIEDLNREAIRKQFEANVFGPIELTNRVLCVMRKQGHGRIVFTGSILGIVALPYRGAYNASKFALEGFIDTLRQEIYDTPIHISLLEPGAIKSKFRDHSAALFQQSINTKQSHYQQMYEKAIPKLIVQKIFDPFTKPPEAVLKKLISALESSSPQTRYYITLPAYVLSGLKRLLPAKALDWIFHKISSTGP